jgi:hypothetical protein
MVATSAATLTHTTGIAAYPVCAVGAGYTALQDIGASKGAPCARAERPTGGIAVGQSAIRVSPHLSNVFSRTLSTMLLGKMPA